PVQLLDDLKGVRLGPLGVEGAQGDVGELHAGRFGHFATAPVGFVVVALHLAHVCAQRAACPRLGVLEAVGVEDVGVHAGLGGVGGDGGAHVSRRYAAYLLLAQLQQA